MPIPLLICVNLLPIGTYFCVLGLIHASRSPLVTTGPRDFLALAFALSGLSITGPLHFILHSRLLPEFLFHSRLAAVVLYLILVAALLPRGFETLVIYNTQESAVQAVVRSVLQSLGVNFREVPGGWMMSDRGVSIEMEPFPALRMVTLHFRGLHDRPLYNHVHSELSRLLAEQQTSRSMIGLGLAAAGGMVLALPVWILARDPATIAAALRAMIGGS